MTVSIAYCVCCASAQMLHAYTTCFVKAATIHGASIYGPCQTGELHRRNSRLTSRKNVSHSRLHLTKRRHLNVRKRMQATGNGCATVHQLHVEATNSPHDEGALGLALSASGRFQLYNGFSCTIGCNLYTIQKKSIDSFGR